MCMLSLCWSQMSYQASTDPRFLYYMYKVTRSTCNLSGWDASPSISHVTIHLNTWLMRDTSGANHLAQEHNTLSLSRAQTQTA